MTDTVVQLKQPADDFESVFWPECPRRVGKKDARKAWLKARRIASLEIIMDGLTAYKRGKPDYADWMHPATFLNGERWTDEYETTANRYDEL